MGAVLAFPQTRRALRHYSTGMDAAGFLSLLLLEQDGASIPDNVLRYDEPRGKALPKRTPELLFSMLIWETLPQKQRARIKGIVRCMAYGQDALPEAVQLHNALRLGKPLEPDEKER